MRVCCTPLPTLGFAEFRACSWFSLRFTGPGPFPSTRAPFEAFSSPAAVSLSCPSRESLPSCRCPFPSQVQRPSHRRSIPWALRLGVSPSGACVGTVRLQGLEPRVESALTGMCFHMNVRVASLGFYFRKVIRFLAAGLGGDLDSTWRWSRRALLRPACPREVLWSPSLKVQAPLVVESRGLPRLTARAMTPYALPWSLPWNGTFLGSFAGSSQALGRMALVDSDAGASVVWRAPRLGDRGPVELRGSKLPRHLALCLSGLGRILR